MGISMLPEEFPPLRREDPKRKAEVRVFDSLENLSHNGHGIYELRFREKGRQLDFALWLDRWGRFAPQIKGGIYRLEKDGKWYLLKPDGSWIEVASPLEETEEGCNEMHNAIEAASNYYGFVVGVLVFPDMERDEQMEWVARNHHHVHIVWGVETLQEDQERIAKHVGIERPPKPYHSEYECRRVFELQYRGINYVNGRRGPRAAGGYRAGTVSSGTRTGMSSRRWPWVPQRSTFSTWASWWCSTSTWDRMTTGESSCLKLNRYPRRIPNSWGV